MKNLSSDISYGQEVDGGIYTMKDNYTTGDNTIRMTPSLYKDAKDNYYYVVRMEENIHHFFLGFLDDMNAGVVSVAKLSYSFTQPRPPGVISEGGLPEGNSLLAAMYNIEDVSVMRNWEWQDHYSRDKYKNDYKEAIGDRDLEIYSGVWNEYQAKDSKKGQKNIQYKDGDKYRTETADVYAESGSEGTTANSYTGLEHGMAADSLNLDFKADVMLKKSVTNWEDFDITPDSNVLDYYMNGASSGSANLRIHSTFNFYDPYEVREDKTSDDNPEDVLYIRIESEAIWGLDFKKDHRAYNSVRQIIININGVETSPGKYEYNTQKNSDGKYIYRPLMFFYAGAEKIDNDSDVRDSQPIILNLNADARIIFFCPNTPIVINGNGHKLQGFVVAKEFHQLDFSKSGTTGYYLKESKITDKKGNERKEIKDEHGNVLQPNVNKLVTDEYGNVQTKSLADDKTLAANYIRNPEYLDLLIGKNPDYLEHISTETYLANLRKNDSAYNGCFEMPTSGNLVGDWDHEKVYKLEAFNLKHLDPNTESIYYVENHKLDNKTAYPNYDSSYYDSFGLKDESSEGVNNESSEGLKDLRRKVYSYLDGKKYDPDTGTYFDLHKKSIDMFFTTVRAGWIK